MVLTFTIVIQRSIFRILRCHIFPQIIHDLISTKAKTTQSFPQNLVLRNFPSTFLFSDTFFNLH